jgi:hypothetical protein
MLRQQKPAFNSSQPTITSFFRRVLRFPTLAVLLTLTFLVNSSVAQQSKAGDQFEVKITRGSAKSEVPFEGIHIAAGDMQCSSTANDIWNATIAIKKPSGKGLTEVLVFLTGIPASGGKTEDVNLGLTFGELHEDDTAALGIGAAVGGGTGVATVERKGNGAVIKIEGSTHYGAGISAVVECKKVEIVR